VGLASAAEGWQTFLVGGSKADDSRRKEPLVNR